MYPKKWRITRKRQGVMRWKLGNNALQNSTVEGGKWKMETSIGFN